MEEIVKIFVSIGDFCSSVGGGIVSLALGALFLLLLAIFVPVFMVKGFKRGTYRATVSIGCTLCSFALALLFAKISVLIFAQPLYNAFGDTVRDVLADLTEKGMSLTYTEKLIKGFLSSALGGVVFLLLFIIFLIVSKLVTGHILCGILLKKDAPTGFKVGGMAISFVDALLVCILLLVPLYSVVGHAANVLNDVAVSIEENTDTAKEDREFAKALEEIEDFCDPIRHNPIVWLSNKPVFNFTTSLFGDFKVDGNKYNSYSVLKDGSALFAEVIPFVEKNPEEYGDADLKAAENIADLCKENKFFFGILSDITPMLGEEKDTSANKNYSDDLIVALQKGIDKATLSDYEDCADSLVKLFEISLRYDILKSIDNEEELLKKISDEDFIKSSVECMRGNKLLSATLDNVMLVSVEYVDFSEEEEGKEELRDTIEKVKKEMDGKVQSGVKDVASETCSLQFITTGLHKIYTAGDGFRTESFIDLDATGVANVLVGIGIHPYVGEKNTDDLLSALLRSFNGSSGGIFSEEFISKAVISLNDDIRNLKSPSTASDKAKFANLLVSAQHIVDTVQKLNSATFDKEQTGEVIGKLMEVMTPDSADTLKAAITEDVMHELDVKAENKDKVGDFVGNVLVNMANVKENGGDPEKEKDGVVELLNLTMNAGDKMKEKEDGSRTGLEEAVDGDLNGFLLKVTDSEVMMLTVDQALEENENTPDPTGSFSGMNEEDNAALQKACQELLKENPDDAELRQKLEKVCLFMGTELN